ncbi:MAG TPA: conjugal transfer protein TrbF [Asticcacaulis sp.]|nr:conjugal transfer protein TrbF [Asticcacaulis sp.]
MFRRSLQRYGDTPEPVTPYQKAAQVWDMRMGSALSQARRWRWLALGAMGVAAALAGGIAYIGAQNRIMPFIVEVGPDDAVRGVTQADHRYTPTDAQIAWFLGQFIDDVRSLSSDPVIVRTRWLRAYAFVTGPAASFLSEQARLTDPLRQVGHESVVVNIDSIVRASAASFQIKWTETAYQDGVQSGVAHWTALASYRQQLPTTSDVLRRNPLGLYITDLAWSKDFGPSVEAGQTSSSIAQP